MTTPIQRNPPSYRSKHVILSGSCVLPFSGEVLEVTDTLASTVINNFRKWTAGGFDGPPVRMQHQATGERAGWVEDITLGTHPDTGAKTLFAQVAWVDPEAENKLHSGVWGYFSPGLGATVDNHGQFYEFPHVMELSIVDAPHNSQVGGHSFYLSAAKGGKPEKKTMTREEMIKALGKLSEEELALLKPAEEPEPAEEPGDGEEPEPAEEPAAPEETVEALKEKLAAFEFQSLTGKKAKDAPGAFSAYRKNPTAFQEGFALKANVATPATPGRRPVISTGRGQTPDAQGAQGKGVATPKQVAEKLSAMKEKNPRTTMSQAQQALIAEGYTIPGL